MWFLLALAASALWGLVYALHEQVYKQVSVLTSLTISYIAVGVVLAVTLLFNKTFFADLETIRSSRSLLLLIGVETAVSIAATIVVGLSIQGRNATVAGLIEISYPIFIIIFTYVLFHDAHLTLGVLLGGVLIFSGIAAIYFLQ